MAVLFFASVFFSGCFSGQIKTRKDEFTGKKVTTVSYQSISATEGLFSANADFDFVREYDSKTESSYFIVKLTVGGSDAKDLDSKCFVKIDDKTFNLSVADRKKEHVEYVDMTTTTTYQQQANGGYDFTQGQKNTEVTGTRNTVELTGKIILPADFKTSVLSGKSVLFRFYSGTDPKTFSLSPEWVENLKLFYQTKE
jgi:hypothetical protein